MRFIKEFKEFAVKGNVVDLAVAVIIGGAFGKIVSSLVADVVMPFIGLIIGGVDFTSFKIILKSALLASDGAILSPAIVLNIGVFIQNIFDFLIIALAIFLMIKVLSRLKKKLLKEDEAKQKVEEAKKTNRQEELLVEIRDLLKNKD